MKLTDLRNKRSQQEQSFYVSFSDLMMLLSVFFILIIGISKVELGSFEKIKMSFSGSSSGTLVELAKEIKYLVEKDPGVPNVKVELTKEGVLLDLKTAALFDSGSYILKQDSLAPMGIILEKIKISKYRIDVEGHSDDKPYYRKQDEFIESNWSLSGMRAASVLNYLLKFGINARRVRLVGHAANRPKVNIEGLEGSELEEARSENRRVSILIR
jgi:chemotaxis protein MotB